VSSQLRSAMRGSSYGIQFARWQVLTAVDIITELVIFALSIYLVIGLQMPAKRKTVIVVAFGLRLL